MKALGGNMDRNSQKIINPIICPVCGGSLELDKTKRYCAAGHSFDLAKEGYTNLLLSNKSKLSSHGDNREMVDARDTFLSSGAYAPLCDALCDELGRVTDGKTGSVAIDAGCGECSYTAPMASRVAYMYGFDVSKDAVRRGAKKCRAAGVNNTELFVASVFDMPVRSASADAVISVFAPLAEEEFSRVLKDDGVLIRVVPGKRHLFGLKKLMYDEPYENSDEERVGDSFELLSERKIDYTLTLDRSDIIASLIKMTPYFYRTSPADRARAENAERIETEVSFRLLTYRKK